MTPVAPIVVRLIRSDTGASRACSTCCGSTKEVRIFAAWSGERHVVCSECLRAGPERIRERLVDKAVRLEAWAEDLRVLAERSWDLPTFEAWVAAIVADGDGEIRTRARDHAHPSVARTTPWL